MEEADRDCLDAGALEVVEDPVEPAEVERLALLGRGTNGSGFAKKRLKKSGRLPRWISSESRKPSVAISAVLTPRRSVSALITTVVPCARNPISATASDALAITSITPASKSGGVVSAFAVTISCRPVSGSTVK